MSATISALKVLKVVSPPKKPVMIKSLHSGASAELVAKKATNKPIKYPPIRFALNVPNGIDGYKLLSLLPKNQRKRAPKPAPEKIAKMV